MPVLRVPFAIDDQDQIVSPTTAAKGKAYHCPACHEFVVFKKGEFKTPHFAHKVTDTCNQETIAHKTAKLLVQHAVREWKSGKSHSPVLQRRCQTCESFVDTTLPDKVDNALLECPLADGSVADVALIVKSEPAAAVEIRVTHAVDETKTTRICVPFVELDGHDVIANPTAWRPITDRFRPFTCNKCKERYPVFHAKLKRVAQECKVDLPRGYYRSGIGACWKCKREIMLFTWPNHEQWTRIAPKGKPVPRTIQYRDIQLVGKCWVNTCAHCHAIYGDMYLGAYGDGPFSSELCEEDSAAAFERDMMKIAFLSEVRGFLHG